MKKAISQTLKDNRRIIFNILEEFRNNGMKFNERMVNALNDIANSQEEINIEITNLKNNINNII